MTLNILLAKYGRVLEKTGCEIGSVSPFGNLFELETFFDSHILQNDLVEFNIGLLTKSINMSPKDLASAVGAKVEEFAKEKAINRFEDELRGFSDPRNRGIFMDKLGNGNFDDLRILQQIGENVPEDIRLEIKQKEDEA